MMKPVARALLAFLAVTIAIALSAAPAAADEGWVITSFHSDIRIATDATLTITEDIRVDFGSLQRHGIVRTIPLRYRYDDAHDRYYEMTVDSVTDGSRNVPFTTSIQNDNEVIQIGNPDQLVTGTNRYLVSYMVVGAMNSFSDHDELFWNVDGDRGGVPKQSVTATVTVPAGSFQKAACYQGPTGSRETCTSQSAGNVVDYAATRQLGSSEQMSVVTALNKGAVNVPAPLLEERKRFFPQDSFEVNPLTLGLSLLIVLIGVSLVAWTWWRHGRDREYLTQYYLTNDPRERTDPLFHHHVITVEFEPPQKLPPAMLGLILDSRADTKDVTASIVDMAVRGFVTIGEVPGKKDWTLTWKGSGDMNALLPYEKALLGGIFGGQQDVRLSQLRGTFAPTLRKIEGQIYEEAMGRKLFTSRPDMARGLWSGIGFGLAVTGLGLMFLLGTAFGWGLAGLAVAVVGVVLIAFGVVMAQRTAAGSELLQHTLGFRLYMTTAERYRQQFAEKAEIFTQLLPYAIVFGCVQLWAKAFEGLDTSASTSSWYVGAGPFQAALLASSLESMNSSISSAIGQIPAGGSASGFGGGGFAGGGGGGGGVGSW